MSSSGHKGSSRKGSNKKTPLQVTGGKFIDALGQRGVEILKRRLGLNTETKFLFDAIGNSVAVTTLNSLMSIPVIPQGNTVLTRNGASLRITKLSYRFSIVAAATTTGTSSMRVIFAYRDRSIGGVAITAAQILQTTTDSNSPYAYSLLVGAYGIRILQDRQYVIGVPTSDIATVVDVFNWSPPAFEMEYSASDTTGVIANVLRGDIEMFIMYGAVGGTIGTAPSVAVSRVTEFVDN